MKDKLFLLSEEEVERYLPCKEDRIRKMKKSVKTSDWKFHRYLKKIIPEDGGEYVPIYTEAGGC